MTDGRGGDEPTSEIESMWQVGRRPLCRGLCGIVSRERVRFRREDDAEKPPSAPMGAKLTQALGGD